MVSSLKNMMKHVLIPCGLATGVDGAPESLHKVRKRILYVNNKLPGVARVKTPRCIKGRLFFPLSFSRNDQTKN